MSPGRLELSALSYAEIAWVLGVIIVTVGGVKLTYAVLAEKVATIARRFSVAKPAKVASGSVMIGSGAYPLAWLTQRGDVRSHIPDDNQPVA